jgi:hypothetical protein
MSPFCIIVNTPIYFIIFIALLAQEIANIPNFMHENE